MYLLLAQGMGFAGLVLNLLAYQCRNSRRLILTQLGSNITYVIHFLMLLSCHSFTAPTVMPFTKYFWNMQKMISAGTMEMMVPANTISHLAVNCPTKLAISTVMVFARPLGSTR